MPGARTAVLAVWKCFASYKRIVFSYLDIFSGYTYIYDMSYNQPTSLWEQYLLFFKKEMAPTLWYPHS